MNAAAAVHTSALPSPRVVDQPLPADWPMTEYSGTLIDNAEARWGTNQAGMAVPVLCMHLELDCPTHNTMRVEQPFPSDHYAQCEAAARRYKKGMHVTVQAPLVGMRLVMRHATHIHVTKETQEPTAPCQA